VWITEFYLQILAFVLKFWPYTCLYRVVLQRAPRLNEQL